MKGVVASVMHTGTWFTFEVIKRLTGDVVLPWRHTCRPKTNGQDCDWLHMHVNEDPWSEVRYIRPMLLEAFVEKARYPTVIPLRDPVLALISRHLRRDESHVPPNARLFEMGAGFRQLARWYHQNPKHIFWFPVDLHEDTWGRADLIGTLSAFVGGDYDRRLIRQIAEEWTIRNRTTALSTLKQRYLAGDVAAVDAVLPDEMEQLRSCPEVAEMFYELGYTLPWVHG